ncbi:hypothetical protein HDU79_002087 [Rhizoclosmatium sp. JEL0117]|nr:hypothetical protein HDU79_002087 [Rhizoclosmatium sp. JEL0117]
MTTSDIDSESDDGSTFEYNSASESESESESYSEAVDAGETDNTFDVGGKSTSNAKAKSSCHTVSFLQSRRAQNAANLASLIGASDAAAALLLDRFPQRPEDIASTFFDDQEKVLRLVGIRSLHFDPVFVTALPGFECPICFANEPDDPTLALQCGHRACLSCYSRYIDQKITQEGQVRIQCLSPKCTLHIDESTIQMMVNPDIYSKYSDLVIKHHISENPSLRFCPSPKGCDLVIEYRIPTSLAKELSPLVTCDCGHSFCFGCSLPDHRPAPCPVVKLWLKKCKDDSETANWIHANTKDCPKCDSAIEKNGGCNHIHCRKCNYHFCWVCMGEFLGYDKHSCALWKEVEIDNSITDAKAHARQALKRYMHYFTRYQNHHLSATLDLALSAKIETAMHALQETSHLSWIDVQFLNTAKHTLVASRSILQWTYCLAFYLKPGDLATFLFEDNQQDLEAAVEALSALLERDFMEVDKIPDLKKQILDKSVYVMQRQDKLLECTVQDLEEGRLTWDSVVGPLR